MKLFLLLSVILPLKLSLAQTVADDVYLNDLIEKRTIPLSYDEMEGFFFKQPLFSMDCAADTSITNEKEAEEVFGPFTNYEDFKGFLKFNFYKQRFGFNVQAQRLDSTGVSDITQDIYRFTKDLQCGNSLTEEQKKDKNCGFFSMKQEEFPVTIKGGESYKPEATKSESWSIYYLDEHTLVAKVMVEFLGTELNWLGSKKGTVTHTKSYYCMLNQIESLN